MNRLFVSSYEITEQKVLDTGTNFAKRKKCCHSDFKAVPGLTKLQGHYQCNYCQTEFNPCLRCQKPFSLGTLEKGHGFCGKCVRIRREDGVSTPTTEISSPILPAVIPDEKAVQADVIEPRSNQANGQSHWTNGQSHWTNGQSHWTSDQAHWKKKWIRFNSSNRFNYSNWKK